MSDASYAEPNQFEPTYVNMQRGRLISNSTYTGHTYNGNQSTMATQYCCDFKRGNIVIGLVTLLLLLQIGSLTLVILLFERRDPGGHHYNGDLQRPLPRVEPECKNYFENMKAQLDYAVKSITYGIPKEMANMLKGEVDRISRDVDKLEVLVLGTGVDLSMGLSPNSTFSLSTGSKSAVCQQYLDAVRKSKKEKCKTEKKPQTGTTVNLPIQITTKT
nr:transmembrane protein [Meliandou uranomys virus]